LGQKDAPNSPDSQEKKFHNILLDNYYYYCLKCEQLPENISGFFFFFFPFLVIIAKFGQFLFWRMILILCGFIYIYYCLKCEQLPENILGFLFLFFNIFLLFLWRDFLTWAHKKGTMGYDLYKGAMV